MLKHKCFNKKKKTINNKKADTGADQFHRCIYLFNYMYVNVKVTPLKKQFSSLLDDSKNTPLYERKYNTDALVMLYRVLRT